MNKLIFLIQGDYIELTVRRIIKHLPINRYMIVKYIKGQWSDNLNLINEDDIIIRWNTSLMIPDNPAKLTLNNRDFFLKSTNKAYTRIFLQNYGIPVPKTWTNPEQSIYPCIARPEYHTHSRDFFILKDKQDFLNLNFKGNLYFSEVYPKHTEYRVHIAGEIFTVFYKEEKSLI
jgi:hypothetical protein